MFSSKIRTNCSPMILRFSSGSVMPRSRSKNRSPASTWMSSMPMCRRKVSTTCSDSPWRMSPVSTYTQVSCGPMARWTSAAATAESTPPDSPQMARPAPTWRRTASTCVSAIDAIVQVGRHPHTSNRKRRSISWPPGVCPTSGWNWTPWIRRDLSSSTATATSAVRAVTLKPSGARTMESKWLIQTGWSPLSSTLAAPVVSSSVRPYSPRPVAATSPPSCCARSCAP